MKDFKSCALGSRCYEQLRVVNDMNYSGSRDLRPLDAMNNSRLRMIWTILGCAFMTLNAKNSLGLCMTWTNLGHKLMTLNSMKNPGLWMIWTTTDPMNSSLQMLWKAQGCWLYEWFLIVCPWLQIPCIAHGCGWHERLQVVSSRLYMLWTTQGSSWPKWL